MSGRSPRYTSCSLISPVAVKQFDQTSKRRFKRNIFFFGCFFVVFRLVEIIFSKWEFQIFPVKSLIDSPRREFPVDRLSKTIIRNRLSFIRFGSETMEAVWKISLLERGLRAEGLFHPESFCPLRHKDTPLSNIRFEISGKRVFWLSGLLEVFNYSLLIYPISPKVRYLLFSSSTGFFLASLSADEAGLPTIRHLKVISAIR